MRIDPNKVRFMSPVFHLGLFSDALRYVGRRNTIQLTETALSVEGDRLKLSLLGLELVFRQVLAEWSMNTIPYAHIHSARQVSWPLPRLLALAAFCFGLVLLVFGFFADFFLLFGLACLIPSSYVILRIPARYVIWFRAGGSRPTRLMFRITSKPLRKEFDRKLQEYRETARRFGTTAQPVEGKLSTENGEILQARTTGRWGFFGVGAVLLTFTALVLIGGYSAGGAEVSGAANILGRIYVFQRSLADLWLGVTLPVSKEEAAWEWWFLRAVEWLVLPAFLLVVAKRWRGARFALAALAALRGFEICFVLSEIAWLRILPVSERKDYSDFSEQMRIGYFLFLALLELIWLAGYLYWCMLLLRYRKARESSAETRGNGSRRSTNKMTCQPAAPARVKEVLAGTAGWRSGGLADSQVKKLEALIVPTTEAPVSSGKILALAGVFILTTLAIGLVGWQFEALSIAVLVLLSPVLAVILLPVLAVILLVVPWQAHRRGLGFVSWFVLQILAFNPVYPALLVATLPHRARMRLRDRFTQEVEQQLQRVSRLRSAPGESALIQPVVASEGDLPTSSTKARSTAEKSLGDLLTDDG